MKIYLKMLSAKCEPFCSCFNVLINPIKQTQILFWAECSTKILAIHCIRLLSGACTIFGSHMLVINFWWSCAVSYNTLRPGQNGCHFADDIFKYFYWKKILVCWFRFPGSLSQRAQVDNKSALDAWQQQAITWTNADQVIWCYMASIEHSC